MRRGLEKMDLEYKGKKLYFPNEGKFVEIQRIIDDYQGRFPKLEKNVKEWWYEKTDFGVYFLEQMLSRDERNDSTELPEIEEDDWALFMPVLRSFFPNRTELNTIVHNVKFLSGDVSSPIENLYWMEYLFAEKYGQLELKDLRDMNYKKVRIFYNYILATLIGRNLASEIMREKNLDKVKGMTM